jgi:hypothetical protein
MIGKRPGGMSHDKLTGLLSNKWQVHPLSSIFIKMEFLYLAVS